MKTGSSSSASFTSHNPWSDSNPRMDSTSKRCVISDVVPALHSSGAQLASCRRTLSKKLPSRNCNAISRRRMRCFSQRVQPSSGMSRYVGPSSLASASLLFVPSPHADVYPVGDQLAR
jgi:hypothetical protein